MMKNTSNNYETRFLDEVEKKISEMEDESYEFPKRFSKKDYIVTAIVILVCLAGVIFGYWHVITGWNGDNAIFQAFKQIDSEEGWFRWAVVKGGMQWAVGGLGFYFMATPILLLISIHTNASDNAAATGNTIHKRS